MIEFSNRNPKFVDVLRDGARIGWIAHGNVTGDETKTVWSGIVCDRVIKHEKLCVAKRQVHDFIEDDPEYDLTEAGREALKQHGFLRKEKVRVAAARGVTSLDKITFHFKIARDLADHGETDEAIAKLEPLKDALLGIIDALNYAGISGQTERKS
jgi:hypothetical protein